MHSVAQSPQPRAAIYARVSTAGQAEHGYSLEGQVAECRALAEQLDAIVVLECLEVGSGADWDLPKLLDLLDRAKRGEYGLFICLATSRLARDTAKLAVVERQLKRAGVAVRYVQQDYDDSPAGRLNKNIMGAIDEFERENIALRFALGKSAKVARGLVMGVGRAPYGYRFVRRMVRDRLVTEGLEVDPKTAPVARRIFRDILTKPLGAVCAALNAEGVLPPGRAGRWTPPTLRNMFANPTYIGQYRYGRRSWTKEGGKVRWRTRDAAGVASVSVPALVSPADMEAARRAMAERKERFMPRNDRAVDPYVLRGLLTCGRCGGLLAVYAAGSGVRYYTCLRSHAGRAALQNAPVCAARGINAQALEELAWTMIRETLLDPDYLRVGLREALKANQAASRRRERLADLRALIRQKRRDLERLVGDWLAEGSGSIVAQVLRDKAAQLEREIRANQAALVAIASQPRPGLSESDVRALEAFATRVRRGFDVAGPSERREVCRLLRLRASAVEDRERGTKLARGSFTINWEAVIELRTSGDRLCNLHRLPTDRPFQLIGLPLKIDGTDGAPARVIAVVE